MSDDADWLQNLKVGDKVFRTEKYSQPDTPQIISRITPSSIFLRITDTYEERYRKSDGRSVGGSAWDTQWLRPCTPKREELWIIERLKRKAVNLRNKLLIPQDKDMLIKFIEALKPFVPETNK